MLVFFFFIVIIADAGFFIDASEAVCCAGFVQYCLSERGFSASAVPEKDDVTNIVGIGHFSISGKFIATFSVKARYRAYDDTGFEQERTRIFLDVVFSMWLKKVVVFEYYWTQIRSTTSTSLSINALRTGFADLRGFIATKTQRHKDFKII